MFSYILILTYFISPGYSVDVRTCVSNVSQQEVQSTSAYWADNILQAPTQAHRPDSVAIILTESCEVGK